MVSRLKDRSSVESPAIRQARSQLHKVVDLLESSETASPDEVVHQVRKRIKKARALLKLIRGEVGKKAVARMDHRLREVSRPLSSVRDASALPATLDRLQQRSAGLVPPELFQTVRADLEARKVAIQREILGDGQAMVNARKLVDSALRKVEQWDLEESRSSMFDAIGRAYRRGREAYCGASANPSSENLHELRKRVKALGYQLQILRGDQLKNPVVRVRLLAKLLASELGEGHDIDILREVVETQTAAEPIRKALDRRRTDLRRATLQRAGVIFQAKTKAFVRILKGKNVLGGVDNGRRK